MIKEGFLVHHKLRKDIERTNIEVNTVNFVSRNGINMLKVKKMEKDITHKH